MKTILFQGDSITDAGRPKDRDTDLGHGYAALVAAALGCECPGEYVFYNRGVSGNRVTDLYARIKRDILNLKPDVMSILIGVNDVWHEYDGNGGNGVDAEKYYKIYAMLIEEIQEALPDTEIMILEPFVLRGTATNNNWDDFYSEVRKRAEKAAQIAEKYGLMFIPLQAQLDAAAQKVPEGYWLADGVHPTMAGHELIKREWLNAFQACSFELR
jgi:lysophospholipase L1-like esterase